MATWKGTRADVDPSTGADHASPFHRSAQFQTSPTSPAASGPHRPPTAATARLGRPDRCRRAGAPPSRPGRPAAGAGGAAAPAQPAAHVAAEDRVAQDPAGSRRLPAALLLRPARPRRVQDRARPSQPGAEAHPRHGAGVAQRQAEAGDDPDLPELSAWPGAVDRQARLRSWAGLLWPGAARVPAPRGGRARQELVRPGPGHRRAAAARERLRRLRGGVAPRAPRLRPARKRNR